MEHVKAFLETSTIHGLSWISGTRRISKLFWIVVVIGGFTVAGYLIQLSFYNWHKSPITTTIETLPISEITFPNVTVCPPKNSFLDLSYDILKSNETKLDAKTRKELFEYTKEVVQESFYKEIMKNLSKLEDPDRYYNWYHGYTKIFYPFFHEGVNFNTFTYSIYTYARSGNISTHSFGDKFDAEKVDGNINIFIQVNVPKSLQEMENVTLTLNVDKNTINEFSQNDKTTFSNIIIDPKEKYFKKNYTNNFINGYIYFFSTLAHIEIKLERKVSQTDIGNLKLQKMPGFRLTWNYDSEAGMSEAKYINLVCVGHTCQKSKDINVEFAR